MARTAIKPVKLRQAGRCMRLSLQRTDRYNALDRACLDLLAGLLAPGQRRQMPLVLEGNGAVFSLGADIRELAAFGPSEAAGYSRVGQQVVGLLEAWPGVTVAWMNGYALGAGLELALGCDVLVASPDLRLGLPGLAWAMVPCLGGLRRLSCRLPPKVCNDLFLGGMMMDALQARAAGLIDRICCDRRSLSSLVRDLGEFPPGAVAAIRSIRLRRYGSLDPDREADHFAQPFASGECQRRLRMLLAE